jgi:hypothetical protein
MPARRSPQTTCMSLTSATRRSRAADQSPSRTRRPSGNACRTASLIAAALVVNNPWFAAMVTAVVLALPLGVVLPAVWSSRSARRQAALAVLEELRRWLRG